MHIRKHPLDMQRQQTYRAWVKWTPMLLLFFVVLFFDTWLSIETRKNDYELNDLKRQQRELRVSLETLRVEEAQMQSLDLLATHAPDLGLITPKPSQVIAVNGNAAGSLSLPMKNQHVAEKLEWESMSTDLDILLSSEVPKAVEVPKKEPMQVENIDASVDDLIASF